MTEMIEPMSGVIDQEQIARELVDRARAEGVALTGPGGLLTRLAKTVLETALEAEMTGHLGYGKHDPAGRDGGNSRNGTRAKTVQTEIGPVEIQVPRDRDGTFSPQVVRKRQRRLDGIDQVVVSLTARGLTTGEISAHLAEVYGASVSKDTISRITDQVIEEMTEWRSRPLDRVYPVLFIDAIIVKVRDGQVTNRPVYVVIGVTVNGERDIVGLWAGDGGEGAKFWLGVLTELKNRGVADVCIVVCDGRTGLAGMACGLSSYWILWLSGLMTVLRVRWPGSAGWPCRGARPSADVITITLMSELPAGDTHDVIRRGGEVVAVVVPIGEYRQLRQAAEEQRVNDEFDVARAGYLARREAGTIRYVSHEEAGRRLGLSSR